MAAIQAYLKQLPARQAELNLMLAQAASVPNMKKSDRESLIGDWMRTANVQAKTRRATPAILKLMGIGVRHV